MPRTPTECVRASFDNNGFVIDPNTAIELWEDVADKHGEPARIGLIEDHPDGWQWLYSIGDAVYFAR